MKQLDIVNLLNVRDIHLRNAYLHGKITNDDWWLYDKLLRFLIRLNKKYENE